jgi:hypothetical protein
MRPTFSSAFLFLFCAAVANAAETTSSSSKSGSRPQEQAASASKEAPKTRKVSKEKAPSSQGDKAAQSEDERFTAARKAAYEDAKVAELRGKADAAKNEEAANKAMRSYLRALYGKMRSLEPSLEERINMTEAAALRAIPQSQQ